VKSLKQEIEEVISVVEQRNGMVSKSLRIRIGDLLIRSDEMLYHGVQRMSKVEMVDLFGAFMCIVSVLDLVYFEKMLVYRFPVTECVECGRSPYDECPKHGKGWVRSRGSDYHKRTWNISMWQVHVRSAPSSESSVEEILRDLMDHTAQLYTGVVDPRVVEREVCIIFELLLRMSNRLEVDLEYEFGRLSTMQNSQYVH